MGKNTYQTYGKRHSEGTLRLVLTRDPSNFSADLVPGELEFISATPQEIVEKYSSKYDKCLLLGGAFVYESFLRAKLVDEIYLSIEPIDIDDGIPLISNGETLDGIVDLPTPEVTTLNSSGTILKHYVL